MNKKFLWVGLLIGAIILIATGIFLTLIEKTPNDSGLNNGTDSSVPLQETISTEINNDTGYSIVANSINSDNALALLIQSNEDKNQMLKIKVDLLNENEIVINSSEFYAPILGHSYYAIAIPCVDDDGNSLEVKSARIQLSKQGEYYAGLDTSSIHLDYSNQILDKKLKTSLALTYNGQVSINDVMGNVVVLKENRIVALTSFSQENIESGVSTDVTVPDIDFSGVENVENAYDNVLVFINSFGFLDVS